MSETASGWTPDFDPRLWRNVMAFVSTGVYGPRASASMLVKALITEPADLEARA